MSSTRCLSDSGVRRAWLESHPNFSVISSSSRALILVWSGSGRPVDDGHDGHELILFALTSGMNMRLASRGLAAWVVIDQVFLYVGTPWRASACMIRIVAIITIRMGS